MRHAFVILALLAVVAVAHGEEVQIEYGSKSELRGIKTIFIDSGDNLEFRNNAVAILEKETPSLRVADKVGDAEIVLVVQFFDLGNGTRATVSAVKPGSHEKAVRLLAKYTDDKTSRLTPKLSTILMRRFARDYREANK